MGRKRATANAHGHAAARAAPSRLLDAAEDAQPQADGQNKKSVSTLEVAPPAKTSMKTSHTLQRSWPRVPTRPPVTRAPHPLRRESESSRTN